jgi:hypothetical protein
MMAKTKAKGPLVFIIDDGDAFPEPCVQVGTALVPAVAISEAADKLRRDGDTITFARSQTDICEDLARGVLANPAADLSDRMDAQHMLTTVADLRTVLANTVLTNKEIGLACIFSIGMGRYAERLRIRAAGYNANVRHSRKSKVGLPKGNATKTKTAQKDYERINAAVVEQVKKRGKRRQPSLTAIRHRVADQLGFKYSKVLDAQRGGRKK